MEVSGAVLILQEGYETKKLLEQCIGGFGESQGSTQCYDSEMPLGIASFSSRFSHALSPLLHLSLGGAVAMLVGTSQDLGDQCLSRMKFTVRLEKDDVSVACTCQSLLPPRPSMASCWW